MLRDRLAVHLALRAMTRATGDADLAALDTAAAGLRQWAADPSIGPGLTARCWFVLAIGLHHRYELTGDRAVLDEAITAAEAAVATAPRRSQWRGAYYGALAMARYTRGSLTGSFDDLSSCSTLAEAAYQARIAETAGRVGLLITVADARLAIFELVGHPGDLEAAVGLGREALRLAPARSPVRATCLTGLSRQLLVQGEHRSSRDDLDEAVALAREAIREDTGPDGRSRRWGALASALTSRFTIAPDPDDLDEAVTLWQRALAEPRLGAFRDSAQAGLVTTWCVRFEQSEDPADLERALALARSAADRPFMRPALALALRLAADLDRPSGHLDEAIALLRAEVAADGPGWPDRAGDLVNLANGLTARYHLGRARSDLDDAVAALREAATLLPEAHTRRPMVLSELALALSDRARLDDSEGDGDAAVAVAREAMATIAAGHNDRSVVLTNCAAVLRATKRPDDLDLAIDTALAALDALPVETPSVVVVLTPLVNDLVVRYERAREAGGPPADDDLAEATRLADRGLAAAGPEHPLRGQALLVRGIVALIRHEDGAAGPDEPAATAYWRAAADLLPVPPGIRAAAARRCAGAFRQAGDWAGATEALRTVVELLDELVPLDLPQREATEALTEFAGLAGDAAACAIHRDDLDAAVELFERGRAVLIGRTLTHREDLSALRLAAPEQAEELAGLSAELDRTMHAEQESGDRRRRLTRERRELLLRIRARAGFERFLAAPAAAELRPAAGDGPIVVVNVSDLRCDALVLTECGVDLVPLPGLTSEAIAERANLLLTATADEADQAGPELDGILGWLWETTAEPVLFHLGHTGRDAADRPVRWCVGGALAMLPLHAAGRHETRDDPVPLTVLDRSLTSYLPMLRGSRRVEAAAGPASALVVAMPVTPGEPSLPGTADAGPLLRDRLGRDVEILTGPTVTGTLTALGRHRWAHFACHAHSDLDDPWRSALVLADGQLTAAALAGLRLPAAELAFLAACSTSRPGAKLPDEAVHLASVLRLAGYRHVVATLWPVPDPVARRVTRTVYAGLPDATHASRAVRDAVRAARQRWPESPWVWAAYAHVGG